jgi:hypothetical protein
MAQARKAKATTKALITFAFNTVSQGLYIRHGLFPRLPLYFFKVQRDVLLARLQEQKFRTAPVVVTDLPSLAEIDAHALGSSREKHHRYLIADGATKAVMLRAGDECVGYAYVSPDGHIGPLAVRRPDATAAALQTALKLAAESGASHISAFIPGASDAALSVATEHGMRITFPMLLMSSRVFGDWTCYLPRNPGFM